MHPPARSRLGRGVLGVDVPDAKHTYEHDPHPSTDATPGLLLGAPLASKVRTRFGAKSADTIWDKKCGHGLSKKVRTRFGHKSADIKKCVVLLRYQYLNSTPPEGVSALFASNGVRTFWLQSCPHFFSKSCPHFLAQIVSALFGPHRVPEFVESVYRIFVQIVSANLVPDASEVGAPPSKHIRLRCVFFARDKIDTL